jgi:hypothetical protein
MIRDIESADCKFFVYNFRFSIAHLLCFQSSEHVLLFMVPLILLCDKLIFRGYVYIYRSMPAMDCTDNFRYPVLVVCGIY